MISAVATPWPLVAGALLTTAAGFAGGFALAGRLAETKVAAVEARRMQCEHARSQDARLAAEAAAALMSRAQGAEAQAARRLAASEAASRKRIEETRREIYTAGRECLSTDLRLRLNSAIGADYVPEAAGAAASAASEPAADPGHWGDAGRASTDADVAAWALDAVERYEACRARIDAIRHWDEVTHGR